MPNETQLVRLKTVIDNLVKSKQFDIGYVSFITGYKNNKLPEDIANMIITKKKFSSSSYYINRSQEETFKDLLLNRFN